jgi:3-(3-hydroxy-phenyl)propionate hydroxylase
LGLTGGLLDALSLADVLIAVIKGDRREEVLDAWAQERRRVFLEETAPTAKENRRRVAERDPEKRRADVERLRRLSRDPEFARQVLLAVTQLIGRETW